MGLSDLTLRTFGGGEIAPGLSARADLNLYHQALRTCRNFVIQRHGGVANRTGTKFVAEVKDSAEPPWLLKFVYNATLTYVMEFGSGYVRFFRNGAAVEVSGVGAWSEFTTYVYGDLVAVDGVNYVCILAHTNFEPPNTTYWYALTDAIYELPTPFTDNLHLLRATQDKAVVTLTHKDYPVHELENTGGDTSWTLTELEVGPGIEAPDNLTGTAGVVGTKTRRYVVTAVHDETGEESEPSDVFELEDCDDPTEADPHSLAWDMIVEASEYRVYCDPHGNNTYGYLGTASEQETFEDTGLAPDFGLTPPLNRELFWATNDHPHTCAYYQQRRVFANTHDQVGTVWASKTGFPSNFSIRSPIQDDDAVTFTLAGRQVLGIQHLIGLKRLVLLTDGGEWIVLGGEDGVLTPSTIHPEQEGHAGSAAAPVPVVIGRDVIFTQYLSRVVRVLRFTQDYQGFESLDLTLYASHLFGNTVVRMDGQAIPHSVVWCVRDDGVLLGLTYLPESEVYGWHKHDTDNGAFLDVCVVPEGDEHAVYVLVEREIDGDTVVYLERFEQRLAYTTDNLTDAFFLDCGITYEGASATAMSGLDHLEGETVYAFTNGTTIQGPFTVTGGAITLTTAATTAQIGLRITAELETLALDVASTSLRGARKNVKAMKLVVQESRAGFYAGPNTDRLLAVRREGWESATALVTGQFEINLTSAFDNEGRVLIQHTNPTPLTILGLIPQFEVGG